MVQIHMLRTVAFRRRGLVLGIAVAAVLLFSQIPVFAAASLSIAPLTWNVIGLDSNNVNVGPNHFPVGARVCNTGDAAATNVTSAFVWDSANALVNSRPGTLIDFNASPVPSLAPAACHDFYYEAEVTRNAAAYDTTRRYHITATAASLGTVSTTTPRELYVEHLISQSRNHILDVKLNGTSVPNGGTMTLLVGQTYTIDLVGSTATNGYEQLESFINFPNTIFQVNSVSTTYTADTSVYVGNPNDKLYGDACKWENDPNSPYYRSCHDVGKVGGGVVVTYQVKILQIPGAPLVNPEPLSSLLYDFSGSSYHYNDDFGTSTRFAAVVDPATLTIAKNFSPDPTNVNGISALTFTITNPNPAAVSGVSFSDVFPTSPGAMVVAGSPGATTNGCGAATFAPVAGAGSISFSNGTVAANSSCTVKVNVTVPATGTYTNTSGHLFLGGIDTGSFATDTLTVNSAPPPPSPVCGVPIAKWTFPSGFTVASPAPSTGSGTATPGIGPPGPNAGLSSPMLDVAATATADGTHSWGSNGAFDSTGALNTAFNDYFELAIDTTGLSSVDLSFAADRKNTNSPKQILVYYGTSAFPPGALHDTLGSPPGSPFPTAANTFESSGTLTFNSGLNSSGSTYFRIYGAFANNNNPGSDLYLDDVTFTGCFVPSPPALSKAFSPSPVAVGGTSTLTFTITNPNAGIALSGVAFSDTLPAGVTVTSGSSAQCGGTLTRTAPSTLSFTGGTLAAGGSCTVTATVTVTTAGPHDNVSGFVTSTEGGTNTGPTGIATASITGVLPPGIAKQFAPNPVLAGTPTTLTFTLTNPNASLAVSGVAFADTFPTSPGAMVVAPAPAAATSGCGAPAFAPTAGAGSISFSGGTIAAGGTCIVTVNVVAPVAGSYSNTSGAVSHLVNGSPVNGNTAADTLTVSPANPAIALLKQVGPTAAGPWSSFLAVPAGGNVFYRFTVENIGNVPLNSVGVTDPQVSTASCTWPAPLPVASPTADPTATCVVGPVTALAGTHPNTATASGTNGTTVTDVSTATYATTGLTLVKSVTETSFTSAGEVLHYSFLVTNTGAAPLAGPVVVADDKSTDESCPAVTTVGDLDNFLDPGESITCTATYTVTVGDVAFGSVTNQASATADGVTSNTDSKTVTIIGGVFAPSIAKAFSPNPIAVGGVSTLTFTVTNSNAAIVLTGVAFTDSFPAGMQVAATPSATTTGCGAPTFAPAAGNTSLSFSGGTIAASGTCMVTVAVTATTAGPKANTTGNVTSTNGGTGNTGTDTLGVVAPPSIAKAFSPNPIAVGGVSTLTFTIANPNAGTALTGVAFTDTFPAGLQVAATPNATTTGCGAPTFAPAAGNTSLSFSGGTIAASGTCTVTVDVTATTTGAKANTTGNVTSTNGGTGNTGSDTLNVNALSPPGIAKAFSPNPIAVSGVSTLTFTITNQNAGTALTGVAFTDTFPAGMQVAATPNATTTGCGAPTFAPAAGNTSLSFSGGTIAASGTCTVTVAVTATTAGPKANTTGNVTSTNGGTGNTGTDTLGVLSPPSIAKAFSPNQIALNGVSTLTFTITNPNSTAALTGVAFTDTFPAGMQVAATPNTSTTGCGSPTFAPAAGNTSLSFSGGTIAASGTCTVTVDITVTTAGAKANTTSNVTSTNGGTGNTGSDTLGVGTAPGITKAFSPDPIAVGGVSTLTFIITNPNPGLALTGVAFTDSFPAGLQVAATPNITLTGCGSPTFAPVAGNTSVSFSGGTIAASGTCTVTVDVTATTAGVKPNTTGNVTSTNGGTGNSASDTLTVLAPPSIAKAFSPNPIALNGVSTLTFTITNPNAGTALTGVAFTDTFPAGMQVAATPSATTTGCGAPTFAPAAGNTSLSFSGGTIAASGTCTVTVAVTATTAGPKVNTTGNVTSTNGGTGNTGTDTLGVASPPSIAKAFSPNPVAVGGVSTLTFTITNPNAGTVLTGVAFTDTFPAGMQVAATPNATTTGCGAPTFAPAAGNTSLSFSGGTIAASGNCTVTIDITVTTAGAKANTTGNVTSTNGGTGNTGTDTLGVLAPPSIAKAFSPNPIALNGVSTLTFTITNPNPTAALTGVAFTDSFPAGMQVAATPNVTTTGCGAPTFAPAAGSTALSFSGGTIAASGTCTVTVAVTATTTGSKVNTTGKVTSTNGGTGNTGSDTLAVNLTAPLVAALKSSNFNAQVNDLDGSGSLSPGDTLRYTIVITNTGNADALAVIFTDTPGAHTTLVAGSVTTTQGTVTNGNQGGATSVTVDLGTLPATTGQATVSFTVKLDNPFPAGVTTILNQGLVHGSNFADVPTDNPTTTPTGDPTVDAVAVPLVPAIPALSEWGALILALLLAGAAARRLRARPRTA